MRFVSSELPAGICRPWLLNASLHKEMSQTNLVVLLQVKLKARAASRSCNRYASTRYSTSSGSPLGSCRAFMLHSTYSRRCENSLQKACLYYNPKKADSAHQEPFATISMSAVPQITTVSGMYCHGCTEAGNFRFDEKWDVLSHTCRGAMWLYHRARIGNRSQSSSARHAWKSVLVLSDWPNVSFLSIVLPYRRSTY